MSLLAELFEGLETPTAGIDTLKTERIRATDPAPRFNHSQNVAATMSSLEIAELVGARHDNVKVSIKRLATDQVDAQGNVTRKAVIQLPALQVVKNSQGQTVSEYLVCKRDSFVVAQLCPEFTAALVDQHDGEPQHLIHTADTATLEWIAARDKYVSHLMACCACYAPTGRHCAAGAGLRQQYDQTPMERAQ